MKPIDLDAWARHVGHDHPLIAVLEHLREQALTANQIRHIHRDYKACGELAEEVLRLTGGVDGEAS